MQVVRWGVDVAMGITFLITFITGLFNWTLLMRTLGLTDLVLPLALMSEIHSWAGLLLGIFVAIHLFINRAWIIAMTRKMVSGRRDERE
jgi:phosphotransferase system  glucose/maltose/N-acetylglucosamine-specific IIC component